MPNDKEERIIDRIIGWMTDYTDTTMHELASMPGIQITGNGPEEPGIYWSYYTYRICEQQIRDGETDGIRALRKPPHNKMLEEETMTIIRYIARWGVTWKTLICTLLGNALVTLTHNEEIMKRLPAGWERKEDIAELMDLCERYSNALGNMRNLATEFELIREPWNLYNLHSTIEKHHGFETAHDLVNAFSDVYLQHFGKYVYVLVYPGNERSIPDSEYVNIGSVSRWI